MVPDAPGIFLSQKHGNDAIRDPEFKTPFLAAAEKPRAWSAPG